MKIAYKDGYLQIDLNKKVEVVIQAGNTKELVLKGFDWTKKFLKINEIYKD